jgi:uncharacterized membrane protein YraQ (UPF0718 family)
VNYPLFERTLGVFGNIFWNIIPVIVLVFGIMFVTNFILTPERTVRYFGKGSGAKGWAVAIVGGILSTGPIYMWYPLLSDLKGRGMKDSLTAAFLYNRAVKIPLMPMMIFYFGWEFTVLLAVYMIIFSIISGVIVGKITGKKKEERGDQYEDSGSLAGEG